MTDSEMEPRRWRKRPVVITAQRMAEPFEVETMEGTMRGKAGDWLITGVQGERYPCDDAIFRQTYEPADGADHHAATARAPDREAKLWRSWTEQDADGDAVTITVRNGRAQWAILSIIDEDNRVSSVFLATVAAVMRAVGWSVQPPEDRG